jgi:hypothetical protein
MKSSLFNIATIFFISWLMPISAKAQSNPFPAKTIVNEDFILTYQCITIPLRNETRGEIVVRAKNPFDYRFTKITLIRMMSPSGGRSVKSEPLNFVGATAGTFVSNRIEKVFTFSGSLEAYRFIFGIRQAKGVIPIPIKSVACQPVRTAVN